MGQGIVAWWRLSMVVGFLLFCGLVGAEESRMLSVERQEGEWFSLTLGRDAFRADGQGEWAKGHFQDGHWRITTSRGERTGVEEKGKIRLLDEGGRFLVALKFEPEKWKILMSEGDATPWIVKAASSEDGVKVKRGEEEMGKVKYYPRDGLVKAKDAAGNTLCRIPSKRPELVAALCLVTDLSPVDRLMLSGLIGLRQ